MDDEAAIVTDPATMHHYLVHGLVVASELQLPIESIPPRPADVMFCVALGRPPLPQPTHSRADKEHDPWVAEHWVGDRLAVEFENLVTFELSRTVVTLLIDDEGDPDFIAHLLLDHVLPRVVALRGDLMLHAAGVVGPTGRAHLFLGPSGAGKTTLATYMATMGWPMIDDDGIRIIHRPDGPRAVPGYAALRLWPPTAAAVLPDAEPGRPMTRDSLKRWFAVDGRRLRMATDPVPIAGLYVLERGAVDEPRVERLGFPKTLTTIVETSFHLADEPDDIARQAFEKASGLAEVVPSFRLVIAGGFEHLPAIVTLIERLDGTGA
jgi:hypothetical protein